MTRAFQRYPILCHRLSIVQSYACFWVFALHGTNTITHHNCTPWPLPPPILTENVVHAPPSTRGASTASCAVLPAQSARLLQRRLRPLWLWLVNMHLHPASIPGTSSLRLLGLLALTVGAVARSMPVAVGRSCRTTLLSAFDVSRSSCRIILPGRAQ